MIAKLTTEDGREATLDDDWQWQSVNKVFEAELREKYPVVDSPSVPGLNAAMDAALAYQGTLEIDPSMRNYRKVPPDAVI